VCVILAEQNRKSKNEITKYFFSKSNNIFVLFSWKLKSNWHKKLEITIREIDKISLENNNLTEAFTYKTTKFYIQKTFGYSDISKKQF
jgi:hypothetical protein